MSSTNSNNNGIEGIYHKLFELPRLILLILELSLFIGLRSPFVLIDIIINIVATAFINIESHLLPPETKEGDCLIMNEDGSFSIDMDTTEDRKKLIRRKLDSLFE